MTDVQGEPQQGGYLPAEIWHAYMAAVTEGQPCEQSAPSEGTDQLQAVLRANSQAFTKSDRRRLKQKWFRADDAPQPAGARPRLLTKLTTEASEETQARPPNQKSNTAPERRRTSCARTCGPAPATGAPARHLALRRRRAGRRACRLISSSERRLERDTLPAMALAARVVDGLAKEDKVEFEGEVIEALPTRCFG